MIIQFCGMSGVGKTTLSKKVEEKLVEKGLPVEVIDGDEYRKTLCKDLGFSKADRLENIRRLGIVAGTLSSHGIITIISAINPYEEARKEIRLRYAHVKTVFIDCSIDSLISRDTKGLYKRALLPDDNAEKISNLTGVNDSFEVPADPDLYINTGLLDVETSTNEILRFITYNYSLQTDPLKIMRSNRAALLAL